MPNLSNLTVPSKLKAGDKVALITSSWGGPGTFPWKYEKGKECLEEVFGLNIAEMPMTKAPADEVYNNPKKRAEDLINAFRDPEIKGIISTIGGDDAIRMLPFIDFSVIRGNPKVYLGYSDSTIVHFMCLKAGLRSYYGPSVMAGFAENGGLFDLTKNSVRSTLFSSEIIGELPQNKEGWVVAQHDWSDKSLVDKPRELLPPVERELLQRQGKVKGRLIGGCMDVLEFMKGTSLWPESSMWDDCVLFFETSEDSPSDDMVTYWLRNYAAQGILHKAKAILIGRPGGDKNSLDFWEAQEQAFIKVVKGENSLDIPILARLDFGHTEPQIILPYGAEIEINCEDKSLRILEAGCG